ncbi:aldehyde dehydrogenase family protein [Kineococcus sp. SYSU DK001]|uniref:aldehyde dehydrogenase family protein n=1 Tax=Kineococcus sp. SYSU DK001 TaxID=3383122 RepID=UPI003D7E7D20
MALTYEELLARVAAPAGTGRLVHEPATGDALAEAPVHDVAALEEAIRAARAAQRDWDALGHEGRIPLLNRVADHLEENSEALAQLLAREQGKPLNGQGARFEVGGTIAWLRATAATPLEPEVVVDDASQRTELVYRPVGLVAAIGPWNWPLMIGMWQIAPSLRMGNVVVVKPSEYVPLSVLALVSLINDVLPADVLHVLSGDREVGARLTEHPGVDKVMFTGSTATGRKIVESSAKNLARLTLELGGNDAGIVLPDADPDAIVEGLFWGAFINTGMTCAALKRLYVHDSLYDRVVDGLAAYAAKVPMGKSLDEDSLLGPVQNKAQFEIVERLVEDARDRGARIVTGGEPAKEIGELFYPITLVADITDGAALVDEEQFGPALPIIRYSDVDDAVASANRLDVGLGASVWTSDVAAARPVAERLEAGTVWVNQHGMVHPFAPFGGVKGSGYGLEFGVEGLKSVAAPKAITLPAGVAG